MTYLWLVTSTQHNTSETKQNKTQHIVFYFIYSDSDDYSIIVVN